MRILERCKNLNENCEPSCEGILKFEDDKYVYKRYACPSHELANIEMIEKVEVRKKYVINYESNFGIGKYRVAAYNLEQAKEFFNKTILRKFKILFIDEAQ